MCRAIIMIDQHKKNRFLTVDIEKVDVQLGGNGPEYIAGENFECVDGNDILSRHSDRLFIARLKSTGVGFDVVDVEEIHPAEVSDLPAGKIEKGNVRTRKKECIAILRGQK